MTALAASTGKQPRNRRTAESNACIGNVDQALGTANKLYEVRRAARDLRGERYSGDMVLFKKLICEQATVRGIDNLTAAMELGKRAQAKGEDTVFMLLMAAFVELTEAV